MYWSAFTLALFGFLRSSKYVSTSGAKCLKSGTLSYWDVLLKNGRVHLARKTSETDPFRKGVTLLIAPTHRSICPVRTLKKFLLKLLHHSGPLFKLPSGKYLTCERVSSIIKKTVNTNGMNPKQYSSHSSRQEQLQLPQLLAFQMLL